ncbi:MAG: tetratricopeptide repeat protein [Chloroflexi bacterium]|nr:tetratricopeptide repeat protein [Chloroflexota bacterium]MCC6892035.1 tetratricopeptide repeat protein [Anaerolineae bacterium]
MRKPALFLLSLVILIATIQPLYAQGAPLIVGVDVYQRATDAFNAQAYEQAVTDYSIVILLNPTFYEPYINRAISYMQLEEYDLALVDLNHVLKLPSADDATRGLAYTARAEIYLGQNNMDAALADFAAAIRATPDDPQAYYERGQIYIAQAEYDKALKDMNQVASIAPDFTGTYYYLGVINNALEAYDTAIENFDTFINVVKDDYLAFAGRASAYINTEQFDQALPDLNEAIDLEPRMATLYLQRGLTWNELGDQQAAASDYLLWVQAILSEQNTDLMLRPGESQVVSMAPGRAYVMSFEGTAGEKVTVTTTTSNDQQIDSLLILTDNQLNPLVADDDGGENFNSVISDFVLPSDGVYAVILSHAGGNSQGSVRLLLTVEN